MEMTEAMKKEEIQKIKEEWKEFYADALCRMNCKISEGRRGWDDQVYEEIRISQLAEKVMAVMAGKHSYKDCVDIANYAMMVGRFQKKRERCFDEET